MRIARVRGAGRRGITRPPAGGGRARPARARGVSLAPAFAEVTIRGMMGRQGRQRGPSVIPAQAGIHDPPPPPCHSRASGNPGQGSPSSFPRKRESRRGWLGPAARPSTSRTIAHVRPHPRKSEAAKTRRGSQDAYAMPLCHFPAGGNPRRASPAARRLSLPAISGAPAIPAQAGIPNRPTAWPPLVRGHQHHTGVNGRARGHRQVDSGWQAPADLATRKAGGFP